MRKDPGSVEKLFRILGIKKGPDPQYWKPRLLVIPLYGNNYTGIQL
jgi:hypothetical protein